MMIVINLYNKMLKYMLAMNFIYKYVYLNSEI